MATTTCVLAFLISLQVAWVQGAASWGYSGSIGPSHWAASYSDCAGTKQSPINIVTGSTVEKFYPSIQFDGYSINPTSYTLENNGHTLMVQVAGSLSFSGAGLTGTKKVAQFHFHWGSNDTVGSEHTVNGNQYPMEVHIVHYDSSHADLSAAATQPKGLAVLGFFFEITASDNPKMDPIVNKLTSVVNNGDSTSLPVFPLDDILPSGMSKYYRYDGSLTTPGCYETVDWTVFDAKIGISASQLEKFRTIKFTDGTFQQNNFRPVQALGAREVFSSFSASGAVQPHMLLIATISAAILFFQKNC